MFNYIRSKETADRLIDKFGMTAILKRAVVTGPAYNPTQATPAQYRVKIAVMNYTTYEVGQGRVRASDKKVYMAKGSLVIDPAPGDLLQIDGVDHVIVGPDQGNGVITLAPAGVVIMYELQCRR